MKRILLLFSLLLMFIFSKCQVLATIQIPSIGLSVKSQLWNMTLINTGSATIRIKITLSLTDAGTGQQVLTANSQAFSLQQGSTGFNTNILPITYTVISNNYNVDNAPDGFLPVGNFIACYQILESDGETFQQIDEQCENIEVEPLSPPSLNSPEDKEEIEELRPFFTWLPPAPLSLFSDLTYKFTLVEVMTGQVYTDAVQQNVPLLQLQNIKEPVLQYPPASSPLDTGKNYAWQISANNNGLPIANSEVWSFKIKSPQPNGIAKSNVTFIQLKRKDNIPFTICGEFLRYEYLNEVNDSLVKVKVIDISNNDRNNDRNVITHEQEMQSIQLGQNFKELDLENVNVKKGHIYLFELTNGKGEKWYVKFEYRGN